MEKEPQPESITNIPMKSDYPPSEVYSSEPPPAYHRHQSASVQVAKIIAVTVVLVSVVLGGFLLASAYVTANASCRQLEQELQLLTETADRLQPPQPEALIQEEPKHIVENNQIDEPSKHTKEVQDNSMTQDSSDNVDNSDASESGESEEEEERVTPIHIKLPLQLDFDDLAGAIIDRNQRSKMNCIVEKKRAEEVVDHQPKTVRLPFGVNLTTDPRYEHVTGERMVILCESGSLQRHTQPQPEEQEETVMIQPVVIPIGPINPFQTHMPQQMPQEMPQQMPQQMHQHMPQQMPQIMSSLPRRPMSQQQMPHPMETLRPPMPGPMMSQENSQNSGPNPFIQHLAQQIINQRIRMEMQRSQEEAQRAQEEASQREEVHVSNEVPQAEIEHRRIPGAEVVMAQRIPIPEEVLRQINRLPNHEVIVSVSEQESEEAPQELRIIQHPRQSAQEMNGRQTYARGLPVHIPVPMMQQQEVPQEQQEQQVHVASSEEMRPHYVQPRSVRSVDALLPKTNNKRVKRCACDCAC